MEDKICPKFFSSYLSNPNIDIQGLIGYINKTGILKPDPFLICLKERCALWIPQYLDVPGHCGLRKS